MTEAIDSHLHYWQIDRGDYGWLTPDLGPLYRDHLPPDAEPHLAAAGIGGIVLVQAAPTEAETRFLLDIAKTDRRVRGVVGWIDMTAPRRARQARGTCRRPDAQIHPADVAGSAR